MSIHDAEDPQVPSEGQSAARQGRWAPIVAWQVARPILLAASLILNVLLYWRLDQLGEYSSRAFDAEGRLLAEHFDDADTQFPRRTIGHGKHGAIYESIDQDGNGRIELSHDLGLGARPVRTWYDTDQDGNDERWTTISAGRVIAAWEDRDGDSLYEEGTFQPGDRPGARWLDTNKDGTYDRFELVPSPGQSVALIDSDRDGMPDQLECDGAPARALLPLCKP